jgi:hypothetical protein
MEVETGTDAVPETVAVGAGLPPDGPGATAVPSGAVEISETGVALAGAIEAAALATAGETPGTSSIPLATTSPLAPLSLSSTVTLPLVTVKVPRSAQRTPPYSPAVGASC